MDAYTPVSKTSAADHMDSYDNTDLRIKEHLKSVLPPEAYEKWISHFVFEKSDSKKIVATYYGNESLKKFKKEYKEQTWLHICSVVGYAKKLEIRHGKSSAPRFNTHTAKKNIKVAKLFVTSMIFAFVTLAVAIIACNYIGNRNFKEAFYNVSSLKTNNKIRVVQISDLHKSTFGKDNQKLIDRVKKLNPDLIIYTGDCLDSKAKSTKPTVDLCSALTKVAPSYYIYGNNEAERFYDTSFNQDDLDKKFGFNNDTRDPQKLIDISDSFEKELESVGVKVLKNEFDTVLVGSTKVDIYGVLTSNPSSFWSYSGKTFDEYLYNNPENLKITAIHEPFIFEEYTPDFWGDLMICGHTHGGIAKIPVLGPLYTHEGGLFPERSEHFINGRYDVAGSPLIVSPGLDNKNPLRINNKPELVIIDINKF